MWNCEQTIPKKYLKVSPAFKYDFLIRHPSGRIHTEIKYSTGIPKNIEPSAFCVIGKENKEYSIYLSIYKYPDVANAILLLGNLSLNGERYSKYLNAYKAYESLINKPELKYAAVRHAVAHSKVSQPKTINMLKYLFGTIEIDLENPKHIKIFWNLYAELLLAIDKCLYKQIEEIIVKNKK